MTTGLSTGLPNWDRGNDVFLPNGQRLENLAEVVSVEARTADGRTLLLPVEYAGFQGEVRGVDQVTVIVPPQLNGAGRVQVTIIAGGVRSNSLIIRFN
jgi:uncharacterized protein (TIGR03437 family)